MKKIATLGFVLLATGCSQMKLVVINTTKKPIHHVEIKLNQDVTLVPEIDPGSSHVQNLSVKKPMDIAINYEDTDGHEFFTSSPQSLQPGDGGSLRLSITAQGTLGAVRVQ